MKSLAYYFVVLILLAGNTLTAQKFDFRRTTWGMDSNQVKKAETSRLVSSDKNSLIYEGKLGEMPARIVFDFNPAHQLYHACYILTPAGGGSKNPMTYVNNYLMLQEFLTKKYNEPYSKISSTINGRPIKQDEWASNLISNNLNLETKWKSNQTEIILSIFSISDELFIEVNYTSILYNKKAVEDFQQIMIKDL